MFDRRLFYYQGSNGLPAVCAIRVADYFDVTIVIWTELNDNKGPSVTNSAETLASQIVNALHLDPNKVIWLEQYEYKPSHLDLLSLIDGYDEKAKRFPNGKVKWTPLEGEFQEPEDKNELRAVIERLLAESACIRSD